MSPDFKPVEPEYESIAELVPLRDCPEGQTRSAVNFECRKPLKLG